MGGCCMTRPQSLQESYRHGYCMWHGFCRGPIAQRDKGIECNDAIRTTVASKGYGSKAHRPTVSRLVVQGAALQAPPRLETTAILVTLESPHRPTAKIVQSSGAIPRTKNGAISPITRWVESQDSNPSPNGRNPLTEIADNDGSCQALELAQQPGLYHDEV